jgi:hypothetical protein
MGKEEKKKPKSFYILGYLLELVIKSGDLDFICFWNLVNLGPFFHEKGLHGLKSYFSRPNLAKFCPKIKYKQCNVRDYLNFTTHANNYWQPIKTCHFLFLGHLRSSNGGHVYKPKSSFTHEFKIQNSVYRPFYYCGWRCS